MAKRALKNTICEVDLIVKPGFGVLSLRRTFILFSG